MTHTELRAIVKAWDPDFDAQMDGLYIRPAYRALIHRLGIREPHGAEPMSRLAQRIADAIKAKEAA